MKAAQALSHSRSFATLLLALGALVFTGAAQAGIKSDRHLAAIISRTPAAHLVEDGEQMQAAERAAAALPGAEAFFGVGRSMEPLYAPRTAVVIQPIAYDDIKKGMTLVYRKANGGLVAHSVIDEDRRGYVVQGVNNSEPDAVSVNEDNLVGVIVAAYSAQESPGRREIVGRLVAKGRLPAAYASQT